MNQFFLDDEDCQECDVILESLENIDDEADLYGIDFVKSDDAGTAKRYHIYNTPALVYFRKQNPVTFEADLTDEEAILNWYLLINDIFPLFFYYVLPCSSPDPTTNSETMNLAFSQNLFVD